MHYVVKKKIRFVLQIRFVATIAANRSLRLLKNRSLPITGALSAVGPRLQTRDQNGVRCSHPSMELRSAGMAAAGGSLKQARSDGRPAAALSADKRIFARLQRPLRLLRGNGRELLMVIPGPSTLLWLRRDPQCQNPR